MLETVRILCTLLLPVIIVMKNFKTLYGMKFSSLHFRKNDLYAMIHETHISNINH